MRALLILSLTLLLAAGCGAGERPITIRGDFADGAAVSVVRAMAGQDAEVMDGAFELTGLATSPVSLRLVQDGDTVGIIDLPDLPAGSELVLHRLRIDPATRRAFPASIEVEGADLVLVNGVRMGEPRRVPAEVDVAGTVLALTDDADALLVRPDDRRLPDLRVFVGEATEAVTPDGDPVPISGLAEGDSLRLEGHTDQGVVIATRLTVPRALAIRDPNNESSAADGSGNGADDGEDNDNGSSAQASDGGGGSSGGGGTPVARSDGRGKDRDELRGRGKGRGGGRGGGKKPKG
jgi:uncharacterized membrane protein YgcG